MRTKILAGAAAIALLTLTACGGGGDRPSDAVTSGETTSAEPSAQEPSSEPVKAAEPVTTEGVEKTTFTPEEIAALPSGDLNDFIPTIEVVGNIDGYRELHEETFEGYTPELSNDKTCELLSRVATVNAPVHVATEDALALAQLQDTISDYSQVTTPRKIAIPSSGSDQRSYMLAAGEGSDHRTAVATTAMFVTTKGGALKQVSLDLIMNCTDGVDPEPELLRVADNLKIEFPLTPKA